MYTRTHACMHACTHTYVLLVTAALDKHETIGKFGFTSLGITEVCFRLQCMYCIVHIRTCTVVLLTTCPYS